MKHRTFGFLLSAIMAVAVSSAFYMGKKASPDSAKASNELMINMTSDATEDAHSALMGLHFAEMALENGMDVSVFLNVDGVKLLLPGARDIEFDGENLVDLLMKFKDNGGTVIACPHCMMINDVDKSKLPEGVVVSSPDFMSAKLMKAPTVFTY